jgi:glycosyltransferase involved in cell wall biosynthesis
MANQECEIRVLTTNANGRDRVLEVPTDMETPIQDNLKVRYCRRQRAESISISLWHELHPLIDWADVVHLEAVYSFPTIPTLWLARRLQKPVVWSPRGALARWSGARHPWLKNIFDQTCRMSLGKRLLFHFTSEQEQEGSLKRFRGAQSVVIPNGVEIPKTSSRVSSNGNSKLHLLYLGRLDPIKGIENLLDACVRLDDLAVPDWELTIAGGGEPAYTEHLRRMAGQDGIAGRVRLIGPVEGESKEAAFAGADMVVVPSHSENFCIVAAEALVRGIPVIASRGTPWSGLESHGCGLWVKNDPRGLAEAVARLSRMPYKAMGEKGRAWMQAEFTWGSIGARMLEVYRGLIHES